jgi:hypothetical protein
MTWLVETLRRYPEIAIFLTLAIGGIKLWQVQLGQR